VAAPISLARLLDPDSPSPSLPAPPAPATSQSVIRPPNFRADGAGSSNYDVGGTGRRFAGWNPTRLGPTTVLWGSIDLIKARCREQVRDNPLAASAIDTFEAQFIGNGIKPRWNIKDPDLKLLVETKFNQWARSRKIDHAGLTNFYGLQALAARELFEAGEIFIRFHVRPRSWRLPVPLQMQLIESEQVPIWKNTLSTTGALVGGDAAVPRGHSIRVGIEFDSDGRRTAYHMYRENPGETMFYPQDALTFIRLPAEDILHSYKPKRAGQLRGEPLMVSVLATLYELDKYMDASLLKKQIASMFTAFITKSAPEAEMLPPDPITPNINLAAPPFPPPGVQDSHIEAGTMYSLYANENIAFPQIPQENDIETFIRVNLHRVASGLGLTYEQLTGDLKGVNYSSIRAGLLDFRRKCEQFQRNVLVQQICQPTAERWLYEAVLSGAVTLPGYMDEPDQYEDITWSSPKWEWVDPQKDISAARDEIRAGLTNRRQLVAERGDDIATIDAEAAEDYKQTDELGLVYDSDPRKILVGRESNPEVPEPEDIGGNTASITQKKAAEGN
jgi:lambda family phage portal protein